MLFSSTSSLWELIQQRPAVVEFLEASGKPVWNQLDLSVDAFCRQAGVKTGSWLREAESIPIPKPDSIWSREPLYRIVDYLVAEHRDFRNKDLTRIDFLLDTYSAPIYPDVYQLKLAYQSFKSFEEGLLEHMSEEEARTFPHILRLEACERNATLLPLTHRLSVKTFAMSQGHLAESLLEKMIAEIMENIRKHRDQERDAVTTEKLFRVLEKFQQRLTRHARIENEILFPRAMEIEKRLLKRQNVSV